MSTAFAHPLAVLPESYRLRDPSALLTPALLVYPELVDANVEATLRLLGGDPGRWRPHVKTAKLGFIMRRLVTRGVTHFKASTTLELLAACEAGAEDVMVAYPMVGAAAARVRSIGVRFPGVRLSALVESPAQIAAWAGGGVGLFVDVNPGMDRTGVEQDRTNEILGLARAVDAAGIALRGLHYYDGHLSDLPIDQRHAVARAGYQRLLAIADALGRAGLDVAEVVTAGTPALPCTAAYEPFTSARFRHRASPGTVVYSDCTSAAQLAPELGYRPAALVLSTVVSHPTARRITCDAGHKTVSADAGVPTCAVAGHPDWSPKRPSEEHLPIELPPGAGVPPLGEALYLVPRHVCPTVNNFDHAVIVRDGRVERVERVTARGREAPLPAVASGP